VGNAIEPKPAEDPKPAAQKNAGKSKAAKPAPKAKTAEGKKAAAGKPREGTHKAEVIAMIQRKGGATLDEIMKATAWQKHYADVRIMPTCVGNPVCGAGIAAMKSA
jgi:hypothetical protein